MPPSNLADIEGLPPVEAEAFLWALGVFLQADALAMREHAPGDASGIATDNAGASLELVAECLYLRGLAPAEVCSALARLMALGSLKDNAILLGAAHFRRDDGGPLKFSQAVLRAAAQCRLKAVPPEKGEVAFDIEDLKKRADELAREGAHTFPCPE